MSDPENPNAEQAAAQAAALAAAQQTAKTKTTRARVLVECEHGQPNDVVELPADVAAMAAKAGVVDTAKEAVAYALTLGQNKKPV